MVKKSKNKKNYIDNDELETLIVEYKQYDQDKAPLKLTNHIYKVFQELCTRVMRSFYFSDPEDYNDCKSMAIMNMFKSINKFIPWREQKVDGFTYNPDGSYSVAIHKEINGKNTRILYPEHKLYLTTSQKEAISNNKDISGEIVKIKNDCFSYFTTSCYYGIAGAYKSLHPDKYKGTVSLDVIDRYIGIPDED